MPSRRTLDLSVVTTDDLISELRKRLRVTVVIAERAPVGAPKRPYVPRPGSQSYLMLEALEAFPEGLTASDLAEIADVAQASGAYTLLYGLIRKGLVEVLPGTYPQVYQLVRDE